MKIKLWKISFLLILILISCKIQRLNLDSDILMGKYIGIGKTSARVELLLEENNEFRFWIRNGHGSDFTQGKWSYSNNTLTLNSKTLNWNDSLMIALSSGRWIVFENAEWKIVQNRFTKLQNKKWKLRKETE